MKPYVAAGLYAFLLLTVGEAVANRSEGLTFLIVVCTVATFLLSQAFVAMEDDR